MLAVTDDAVIPKMFRLLEAGDERTSAWLRIGGILLISIVYLSAFYVLGLLISTVVRRTATALMLSILRDHFKPGANGCHAIGMGFKTVSASG